jgi:hypothetical protein
MPKLIIFIACRISRIIFDISPCFLRHCRLIISPPFLRHALRRYGCHHARLMRDCHASAFCCRRFIFAT